MKVALAGGLGAAASAAVKLVLDVAVAVKARDRAFDAIGRAVNFLTVGRVRRHGYARNPRASALVTRGRPLLSEQIAQRRVSSYLNVYSRNTKKLLMGRNNRIDNRWVRLARIEQ